MGEFLGVIGGITGLIGGMAAILSLVWIRQQTDWMKQQTRTAGHQLFISVAKDIHERYSALYPDLCTLPRHGSEGLTTTHHNAVSQYVNLCAEEYLWKERGIVEADIWEVWECAIRDKFNSTVIREMWKAELCRDRYYKGFADFIDRILLNESATT